MTLAQLEATVKRLLGIYAGVTDPRLTEATAGPGLTMLRDAITEARTEILQRMAIAAPLAVSQTVSFVPVSGSDTQWSLPFSLIVPGSVTIEPLFVSRPRNKETGERLRSSAQLNADNGEYRWITRTRIQLLEGSLGTDLEVDLVEDLSMVGVVDDATIGLPAPFHHAAAHLAASLYGGKKARASADKYEVLMERLETVYSQIDEAAGTELREEFLLSQGALDGD